jgi:opacity protein-like surface antigen
MDLSLRRGFALLQGYSKCGKVQRQCPENLQAAFSTPSARVDNLLQLVNFSAERHHMWFPFELFNRGATTGKYLLSPPEVIMAKRIFFICLALLFVATSVSAKPYFSLGGMWVDLRDADVRAPGPNWNVDFDDGWGAFVAVGKQFELFRLEGEAAYRRNDIERTRIGGIGTGIGGDKVEAMSGMVNAYLDFDMLQFRPFVGVGAGMARIDADLGEITGFGRVDDDDNVFAYQAMVGISFAMQPVGFDIGYRYFATEDPKFGDFKGEYETHNIYLAIRF